MGNIPLLSGGFGQENYYNSRGEMKGRKDWFDYGASVEYSRAVNKRSRIGLELSLKRFEVASDNRYESSFAGKFIGRYTQTTIMRAEQTGMNTIYIIPTFHFSPKNTLTGTGLSHKIGVGMNLTSIQNKNYYYAINEFYYNDSTSTSWTNTDNYNLDVNWQSYKALTLTYALNFDIPITKVILFSTAFQYYINIYFKPSDEAFLENRQDYFNYEDLFYNTQRENLFTWNLKLGLCFAI